MSSLDLTIYSAFINAGVKDEDAKRAAESVSSAIDNRFALHSKMLATQGDVERIRLEIEKLRVEMVKTLSNSRGEHIKWTVGTMFGAVAMMATIAKLLG